MVVVLIHQSFRFKKPGFLKKLELLKEPNLVAQGWLLMCFGVIPRFLEGYKTASQFSKYKKSEIYAW